MSIGVPSGIRSLIAILNALESLHGQVLNIPDTRQQGIEQYGIMVPRWAARSNAEEALARSSEVLESLATAASPAARAALRTTFLMATLRAWRLSDCRWAFMPERCRMVFFLAGIGEH